MAPVAISESSIELFYLVESQIEDIDDELYWFTNNYRKSFYVKFLCLADTNMQHASFPV